MQAPLFVLTCMRSYSSLVSAMLGQHPDMYGLPELNLFMADTLAGVMRKLQIVRPQSLHGLLRAVAQAEYQTQTVATIEKAQTGLQRYAGWSARRFLHHLAECTGSRILIDKSPSTALNPVNLKRLQRNFPEARILHLVRHPRATCQSIHELRQKTAHSREERQADELSPEQLWLRINRNILDFTERLPVGQGMRIQGEQLLTEPERYLAQIAEWLGLSSDAHSLDAMLHPENSPYACIGPSNARFGNDPNFLRNPRYAKKPIPPQRLEGPLAWQRDGAQGFSAQTVMLARRFGYR
ncbi:MAG: sulfotransferase [Candidatus Competibacteraceae bacterium]|nr:sulfotransferase [Candidatus Competibacteraceae bacterium]